MVRRIFVLVALTMLAAPVSAESPPYEAGQVWQYRTRPGEENSLLRIAAVEADPKLFGGQSVYHVSVIGVQAGPDGNTKQISHLPVARDVLDRSVTGRVESDAAFPDAAEGIAQWRSAHGGIFSSVSMAEIVGILDETIRKGRLGENAADK